MSLDTSKRAGVGDGDGPRPSNSLGGSSGGIPVAHDRRFLESADERGGDVELDAQYRQLREECGLLDRSGAREARASRGAEAAEYLQGQLTNDVEALEPGEGRYAALLDRKGHMQADMRVLRLGARSEIWVDTEPRGPRRPCGATSRCTRSAARSSVADVDRGAGDPLADRAAQRRDRRHSPALPEYACETIAIGGVDCLAVGTERGIDLIAAAADASGCARRCSRPAPPRSTPRRPRSCGSRPARPRFGAEMGTRDDARRGRHRRGARSASPRAATSARRRSPASTTRAGPTATCAGCG